MLKLISSFKQHNLFQCIWINQLVSFLRFEYFPLRNSYSTSIFHSYPQGSTKCEKCKLPSQWFGLVRITHATPGALYAHTTDRNWEADINIPEDKKQ